MNLEECYEAIGGNYEEVKLRLHKDELIKRFMLKFLSDKSYEKMTEAFQAGDYEEAYHGAHSLKGVCQNLGINRLGNSTTELTKLLYVSTQQGQVDEEACKALLQQVSKDYAEVVDAIGSLSE